MHELVGAGDCSISVSGHGMQMEEALAACGEWCWYYAIVNGVDECVLFCDWLDAFLNDDCRQRVAFGAF